jgi:hypothetical protein
MILADDAERRGDSFNLLGVRHTIQATAFPYEHPQLCVYLELTGHQRQMPGFLIAADGRNDASVFRSRTHSIRLTGPLTPIPVLFRMQRCRFPAPGLYWIQFYGDEQLLVEHRLYLEHIRG